MILNLVVSPSEDGLTLLSFLKEKKLEVPSIKAIKRAIEKRCCRVNGKIECFSSHPLKSGDRVQFDLDLLKESLEKIDLKLPILYEDEELLICNKPSGMCSEEKEINQRLPQFNGELLLVHRLDKDTSGLLILAKNKHAEEEMTNLFSKRLIEKSYLALVDGVVKRDKGEIKSFLKRIHQYQGQSIYGSSSSGKQAITYWQCLQRKESFSLLLLKPKTGRTHQLRVHMKEMGHSILGDYQYSKKFRCQRSFKRQQLHAYRLSFVYRQRNIHISAPLPEDFFLNLDEIPQEI